MKFRGAITLFFFGFCCLGNSLPVARVAQFYQMPVVVAAGGGGFGSCGTFTLFDSIQASGATAATSVDADLTGAAGGAAVISAVSTTSTITVSSSPANFWVAGNKITVNGITEQLFVCTNLTTSANTSFTINGTDVAAEIYVFTSTGTIVLDGQAAGSGNAAALSFQPGSVSPFSGSELFITGFGTAGVLSGTTPIDSGFSAPAGTTAAGPTDSAFLSYKVSATAENPTWATESADGNTTGAALMMMLGSINCASGTGLFPSDSVVLNWKFDGDTADASGNGNNGTSHPTTSFVADETGVANRAIQLDGTAAYVDAASTTVANFTSGDFSVVMYFTNNAADYSGSPCLFGNNTFGQYGYNLSAHVAFGGNAFAAEPQFSWHDASGDHTIAGIDRSISSMTLNYCIVFVRSGTSGKIYVNGTDVTQAAQPSIGTITSSANKFAVGKAFPSSNFLNGNVQQLIVYSRALTPTEVSTGSAGTSQ